MVQNIQKYVTGDHDGLNQNIEFMIKIFLLRVKYRTWGVPRPYRGWLDRFMWLFYHFVRFYGPKHLECLKIYTCTQLDYTVIVYRCVHPQTYSTYCRQPDFSIENPVTNTLGHIYYYTTVIKYLFHTIYYIFHENTVITSIIRVQVRSKVNILTGIQVPVLMCDN